MPDDRVRRRPLLGSRRRYLSLMSALVFAVLLVLSGCFTPARSHVVAAMDGVVRAVFWNEWGGKRVEVAHVGGLLTTYNHLDDIHAKKGDALEASQQLGTVGMTGSRVTGPHLHFETWVDDKAVDPQSFNWIDQGRVIRAPREAGQEVQRIPSGGLGDETSLDKAKDCPYPEDHDIECSAPDAVDREERCSTGGDDSDCPDERREVQCPEGGPVTAQCPDAAEVQCPEGGPVTPECPTVEPPACPPAAPGPVDCEPLGAGPEDCPPTVPGQVDCFPPGQGLEDCAVLGPGVLDCAPAGAGPEDCPAAEGGRTDCPVALPPSEGSSSGNGGDVASQPAGAAAISRGPTAGQPTSPVVFA